MIKSHNTQDRNVATKTTPRNRHTVIRGFQNYVMRLAGRGDVASDRTRAQGRRHIAQRHTATKTMSCGFQNYVWRSHRHITRYCIRYAPRQPDRAQRGFQYYVTRYTIPRRGVWKTTSAAGLPPQPHFSQKGACSRLSDRPDALRSTTVSLSRIRA